MKFKSPKNDTEIRAQMRDFVKGLDHAQSNDPVFSRKKEVKDQKFLGARNMVRTNKLHLSKINEKFSNSINNDFEDYEIPILSLDQKTIKKEPEIEWTKSPKDN